MYIRSSFCSFIIARYSLHLTIRKSLLFQLSITLFARVSVLAQICFSRFILHTLDITVKHLGVASFTLHILLRKLLKSYCICKFPAKFLNIVTFLPANLVLLLVLSQRVLFFTSCPKFILFLAVVSFASKPSWISLRRLILFRTIYFAIN